MVYEYEKENIRKLKSYNILSGGANITKPIKELEEVYRKAKALERIKDIHSDYSIGDAKCIEMIGDELERADDDATKTPKK